MKKQENSKASTQNTFVIKKLLTGLENGPVDSVVLEYLKGLAEHVHIEHAVFIHALAKPDFFSVNEYIDTFQKDSNEEKLVRDQLRKMVEQAFAKSNISVSTWVGEGNPLEVLLRNAEELNSDLVAIGQKSDTHTHGITAKNFARHVKCNALVIPDQATFQMRKILVPVDFSENSGKALLTALALAKSFAPAPKIEVLHLFELPPNIGAYRYSETKLLSMIREDRESALPAFVNSLVRKKETKNLKLAVEPSVRWPIGHHLAQYAHEHGHDLIVNGAKGHSPLGLLLLGSVTEKLLAYTSRVPVLIVK